MKVITYSNGRDTIDLTPAQISMLEVERVWLRDEGGEYCQVSHGLHAGTPTYSDRQVNLLLDALEIDGVVAR